MTHQPIFLKSALLRRSRSGARQRQDVQDTEFLRRTPLPDGAQGTARLAGSGWKAPAGDGVQAPLMFLAVGISHRTAPLDVRERIAFTRKELKDALAGLRHEVGEGVILSTCNRTEFYSMGSSADAYHDEVRRFLGRHRPVQRRELSRYLYAYEHEEAASHLFRVVSGLDSMILGESQILGQVRDAYAASASCGHLAGPLSKLFHQALRVGKRVRRETGIGRCALSISHAAVELARGALGDLRRSRVMVVGAGEAGKLVARSLTGSGVDEIVVVNRTLERAQELARYLGAQAASFDEMEGLLGCVDIVVSATDAQEVVIPLGMMKKAMAARGGEPLIVVDIAVPRDVDPRVAGLDNVSLFDLDDLESVSNTNLADRQTEVARAKEIIEEETAKLMEWWTSLEVVPVISALREQAEALRRRELGKALKRMPHLSEQDAGWIEALTKSLAGKFLHQPIAAIRRRQSPAHMEFARELFGLDGVGPDAERSRLRYPRPLGAGRSPVPDDRGFGDRPLATIVDGSAQAISEMTLTDEVSSSE